MLDASRPSGVTSPLGAATKTPLSTSTNAACRSLSRLSDERIAWIFDMLNAGNIAHARRRLIVFFHTAPTPRSRARATRSHHRPVAHRGTQVLAYHTTGQASNGRVANVHIFAEKIRRNAHGFADHDRYRNRLIGRLGIKWTTVPTRGIRGRQPHSVA